MTQMPMGFMLPDTGGWMPPDVSALPSWADAKRVSVDLETKDPQLTKLGPGVRRDGSVIGIGFAIEDGPAFYLPIAHEGGGNLDAAKVWAYMRDQAKVFKGDIVGANFGYDLDYLIHNGVNFNPRYFRDVQVAEPIIDELQYQYGLDAILKRYGLPGKDEDKLRHAAEAYGVNPKKEMYKLPGHFVAEYAIADVRKPLALLRLQEKRIEEEGLWDIYNLESKVLPILVKMRRRGVRIDEKKLDDVELWSVEQERQACRVIYEESNVKIGVNEINTDELVLRALTEVGIEITKTTKKGAVSVAADAFKDIDHPICHAILRARAFNKLRGTFVESIRKHMVNGRVHCTFNQLRSSDDDGEGRGTVSGRLSSTDPNLQQQPNRKTDWAPEIAEEWRKIYLPEEGELWACNDFSQQEPRWVVHFAELCDLPKASVAADRYRTDPDTDFHTMMSQIIAGEGPDWVPSKKERSEAKIIYLGMSYGMGGPKLCHSLGYPTGWKKLKNGRWVQVAGPEGQAVMDRFNKEVPFVKRLADRVESAAKKRGYIMTALGRRCRFPLDDTGRNREWTHKALNRLIQGSSADQVKKAMVDADEAGFDLLLQVHDELDLSVPNKARALELSEVMMNAVTMNVPAKVDVEVGPSWGEIK